jgi:hypothetical protein
MEFIGYAIVPPAYAIQNYTVTFQTNNNPTAVYPSSVTDAADVNYQGRLVIELLG